MKTVAAVVVAVVFLIFSSNATAVKAAPSKPPTSVSYYVYATSDESDQVVKDWAYHAGYLAGQTDLFLPGTQNNFAILDFGQPWESSGKQGTWSFNSAYGRFLSTTTIQDAVKEFARGYYNGSGSDVYSQMRVGVGTNNYGSKTTYAHGQAWARLVKDVGSWLASNNYGKQVSVRGASDIEMSYSSVSTAYNWVNGYNSAWSYPYYMYDYGDAAGCPQSGTTSNPGKCNNGWTQDHVEYVSWGAASAVNLPEIYSTAGGNAKQWQQIALYSYLKYGRDMVVYGPLSQSLACAQRGGCSGTNNTPDQAWSQLWNELNKDSRTKQNLSWSSDIKWRK